MKSTIYIILLLIPILLFSDDPMGELYLKVYVDSVNCEKTDDLTQKIEEFQFEDYILPGEILRSIATHYKNRKTEYSITKGNFVIISDQDQRGKFVYQSFDLKWLDFIETISDEELAVGIFFNVIKNIDTDIDKNILKLGEISLDILKRNESKYWKIIEINLDQSLEKNLSETFFDRKKIIKLVELQIKKYKREISKNDFIEIVDIVNNREIPPSLKSCFILRYFNNYKNWLNLPDCENSYLENLKYYLENFPEFVTFGYENYEKLDINLFNGTLSNLKKCLISRDHFFEMLKDLDKEKISSHIMLLSDAFFTKSLLQENKNDLAEDVAFKCIRRFNQPVLWESYKDYIFYNGMPILVILDHLIEENKKPDAIITFIEKARNASKKIPEFQEYLDFRKAMIMDYSSYSLSQVKAAYETISRKDEISFWYSHPFVINSVYMHYLWQVHSKILPEINKKKRITLLKGKYNVKTSFFQKDHKKIEFYGLEGKVLCNYPFFLQFRNVNKEIWEKVETEEGIWWLQSKIE